MTIREFKEQLKNYKALIGIDYGSKRIGIAVSDLLRMVATSYKIIQQKTPEQAIDEIIAIIKEKEACGIVIGLPLQMNGEEGETAVAVRAFAAKLQEKTNLPILFWDERLSSSAAERFLIKDFDLSRAKRKKVLDSTAAAYILQGALDALSQS